MKSRSLIHIVWKEFKSYFLSPIAYIVITIFLIVTGWFFFSVFFIAGRADQRDFFSMLPIIFSFTIPAITMRLFSEELRSGSYEILMTLPTTPMEIMLGKYLASLGFIVLMLVPTLSYSLFISMLGDLDWGPVIGGYLGAVLLAAAFCALGLFASSLTKNQIIAFIIGTALCFFLTMIDKMLIFFPASVIGILQFLGADYHFSNISKGIIDSRDVAYFLSVCFLALYGTHVVSQEKT